MSMVAQWFDQVCVRATRLRRAFDGRSRGERLLLIGVGMALVWLLADSLWLSPAFKDWSAARARLTTAAADLQRLNDDIVRRGETLRRAEQQLRNDVTQLRERVGRGESELRAFGATLVSASDMVPMIDMLLAKVGGVRLRSMQSLGRTEMGASAAAQSASGVDTKTTSPVFRHGVELTVEGSYADVVAYLRAIEDMPQHVLWGGLQLKVERYPEVVLTLRLYTLSQDRNWLEI